MLFPGWSYSGLSYEEGRRRMILIDSSSVERNTKYIIRNRKFKTGKKLLYILNNIRRYCKEEKHISLNKLFAKSKN